jgi:PAS domain S-box-containing protein
MTDQEKTQAELIAELDELRLRLAQQETRCARGSDSSVGCMIGERCYKVLFDKAAEGIMVSNVHDRRIVHANPALCRMFGYSADEITGLRVENLHPAYDQERIVTWFASHTEEFEYEELEGECLRRDGGLFRAELRVSRVGMGDRSLIMAFVTDVSNRRQIDDLARIQRDLAQSLNATSDLSTALRFCLSTVIRAADMDSGGS